MFLVTSHNIDFILKRQQKKEVLLSFKGTFFKSHMFVLIFREMLSTNNNLKHFLT